MAGAADGRLRAWKVKGKMCGLAGRCASRRDLPAERAIRGNAGEIARDRLLIASHDAQQSRGSGAEERLRGCWTTGAHEPPQGLDGSRRGRRDLAQLGTRQRSGLSR